MLNHRDRAEALLGDNKATSTDLKIAMASILADVVDKEEEIERLREKISFRRRREEWFSENKWVKDTFTACFALLLVGSCMAVVMSGSLFLVVKAVTIAADRECVDR